MELALGLSDTERRQKPRPDSVYDPGVQETIGAEGMGWGKAGKMFMYLQKTQRNFLTKLDF